MLEHAAGSERQSERGVVLLESVGNDHQRDGRAAEDGQHLPPRDFLDDPLRQWDFGGLSRLGVVPAHERLGVSSDMRPGGADGQEDAPLNSPRSTSAWRFRRRRTCRAEPRLRLLSSGRP